MSTDVKFDEEKLCDWNIENQPWRLTVEEEQVQNDKEEIQYAPSPLTQVDTLASL